MHKILKELDTHFIVELPNGVTIKVAKGGLTDKVKDKVLYLAEGGMVPELGFIPEASKPTLQHMGKVPVSEQLKAMSYAPSTPDVYRTAVDQPRPLKQGPVADKMPEQAPGGAEEPLISPIDFITPGMITAPVKALGKGAGMAAEKFYEAQAKGLLGNEIGAIGKNIGEVKTISKINLPENIKIKDEHIPAAEINKEKEFNYRLNNIDDISYAVKNNSVIGHLGVDENNAVKAVYVDPKFRKKGVAEQLYTDYVYKNGVLKSDDINAMEPEAKNLWEKLQKKYPEEITETKDGWIWDKNKNLSLNDITSKISEIDKQREALHVKRAESSSEKERYDLLQEWRKLGKERDTLDIKAQELKPKPPEKQLSKQQQDAPYRDDYTAPGASNGAPLSDFTKIYPDDVYSSNAVQYYGTKDAYDSDSISRIQRLRNKPNAVVEVYRAVPKGVKEINEGDWVTPIRQYAKEHGEARLSEGYKILKKRVKAGDLYNDGNSIHEFGWDPKKKYAMGGMVEDKKGNNMDYKMLKNEKDFYVMQHPDGSSFKVAKKGLKPEVKSKIESYSKFMQKAEGGVIPGVDQPEQMASEMPQQPKEPDFAQMVKEQPKQEATPYQKQLGQATQDIESQLLGTYAKTGIPEEYTPERIRMMAEERVLGEKERESVKQKNVNFLANEDQQRRIEETLAYNARAAKVGMPLRPVPGQKQELPLELEQQKQGGALPDMPPKAPSKTETDPFKLYEEGLTAESRAKQIGAQEEAKIYKNLQTDINAGNTKHNETLKGLYDKQTKFEEAASQAQVNPDKYWQEASVPRKISASIGLILGGIGGALTGTENAALKIINNTIDRDIEAQKKNIDQKNNLYRMNLETIKNEKEAYNVTKAQMIGLAELKLKEQMARTSSQEAIAQGKIALGKLQLAKQQLLQQTALDNVLQLSQEDPSLLTPEIIQKLPREERELIVPGYGRALSKAGAEKIRTELLPQKDTSVQMIDDLINLRQKYGREITNRDVVNEANALRGFLRGQMRTFLVGPGAVTENEQKILDSIIADPTKILSTDSGTLAALNSLKNSIDKSFVNQAKANGLMVKQPQAQGQQPVRGADGKMYIQQGRYMVPVK